MMFCTDTISYVCCLTSWTFKPIIAWFNIGYGHYKQKIHPGCCHCVSKNMGSPLEMMTMYERGNTKVRIPHIGMWYVAWATSKKQVIRVKKTRGAAAPRTRITCELFGKPKNAVCI